MNPFSQMHVVLFACVGFHDIFSAVLNTISELNPSSNWNTRVISDLQGHQEYLFAHLTDVPDVTWWIHL